MPFYIELLIFALAVIVWLDMRHKVAMIPSDEEIAETLNGTLKELAKATDDLNRMKEQLIALNKSLDNLLTKLPNEE